jgi:hypothetical protein
MEIKENSVVGARTPADVVRLNEVEDSEQILRWKQLLENKTPRRK